MKNIIEVSHLTKQYGEFKAVNDISFEVEEGSIFAFLGPNGAGKSSTINTLCTITDKTSGTVLINGHDLEKEKDKVRKDIGIVFQESTIDESQTVEENLKYHCSFYHVPKEEVKERIDFVLDLVDMTKWRKAIVGSLSGGMKRRVEIARGLVHYPKVLFLDEPTTGLDPQTRANIWEYIQKLQKEKNITIFLTTHYMDEAEVCSKIVIMDHGKIVACDTPDKLKKTYTSTKIQMDCSDDKKLEGLLKIQNLKYTKKDQKYIICARNGNHALKILETCKPYIQDFEVKKGTINDAFLEITGREIREA